MQISPYTKGAKHWTQEHIYTYASVHE